MQLLASLGDIRDVVVIVYGIIGILFFIVALILAIVLGLSVRGLLKKVRLMLDDSVMPAVSSVKEAADTIRGTTEFVSRTTVAPVLKAYGAVAGLRKGLGVLSGLNRRGRSD